MKPEELRLIPLFKANLQSVMGQESCERQLHAPTNNSALGQ